MATEVAAAVGMMGRCCVVVHFFMVVLNSEKSIGDGCAHRRKGKVVALVKGMVGDTGIGARPRER